MASSFNLLRNPELDRILRINLPARRLLFIGGFALAIALVVSGLQWNSYASRDYYSEYDQARHAARETYYALTVILFGLMFVLAPAMTALSFIQEKLRGTAIFQQMILMKPLDIAVGKFLGSGATSYFAALIILPFALVAALIGAQDFEKVFTLYLFLFIGGLAVQAVGLFVSAAVSSPAEKSLRGGLLLGPGIGVLGAVTALFCHRYFTDYRELSYYSSWHFYGLRSEGYAVILAVMIFIGFWAFVGAVRKIKSSQLVPVSAWPVWLFFITAEAVLVGVLWGWQTYARYPSVSYGSAPIKYLLFYMAVNWGALLVLAGGMAVDRNRLRECWNAGDDPLGLFQREEIKSSVRTFVIALVVSLVGLAALWLSYHQEDAKLGQNLALTTLVPILISFALGVVGSLCFIQYSAMQRFRARAWAGIGLIVSFYLVMAVAGTLFKERGNTANLVNPLLYAYELTEGDLHMDRVSVTYKQTDALEVDYYNRARYLKNSSDGRRIAIHGLIAQTLLACGCFGLVYLKWRRIEGELLENKG